MHSTSLPRLAAAATLAFGAALAPSAAAAPATAAAAPGADQGSVAPLRVATGKPVPGRYIVMLKAGEQAREAQAPSRAAKARAQAAVDAATRNAERRAERLGIDVIDSYRAVGGFSADLTAAQVAQLRRDPEVAFIEQDSIVEGAAEQTQTGAPWHLDRLDQAAPTLDGRFVSRATGAGVRAYIVDSGVRADHADFSGRVTGGFTSVQDGNGTGDCNGHGTGVASLTAGETYGVAKDATIVPVRVLDCQARASFAQVIAGVDWVAANAQLPAVANISIQGDVNAGLDAAVQTAVQRGVSVSVAAGNSSKDACTVSPAHVPGAITVGNVDSTDARNWTSNFGTCVDIFAPGTNMPAAGKASATEVQTMTGTSMAAPLTAGAAALLLETAPATTPAQVEQRLISDAVTGRLTDIGAGSPNRLLNVSRIAPAPAPAPVVGPVVVNGGFESGATGWSGTATGILQNSSWAKSGVASAQLLGHGTTLQQSLTQRVQVPATATTLTVSVRVWSEDLHWGAADYLNLRVQDQAGAVRTLATWTNLDNGGYVTRSFDVSAYRGQAVTLRFDASEDYSMATAFLVDDVVIR